MRWVALGAVAAVAAIGAGACGDNILPDGAPLETAANVAIVARLEDPAILAPDLPDLFARRSGVTVIHLASARGNADELASIAAATGAATSEWDCGWITIEARPVLHCHLGSARISLVYLGFTADELATLWGDQTGSITTTTNDRNATYDREALAQVIDSIVATANPTTIRTLDLLGRGAPQDDPTTNDDRAIAGALAYITVGRIASSAEVMAFRATTDTRAAVGTRTTARGLLTLDHVQCLSADANGTVSLVACAGAPAWTFARDGKLHLDADRCLQVLPTDELVVGACATGGPGLAFHLDDEGHIFTSTPPIVGTMGLAGNATCIGTAGGRARAKSCTATTASTWFVDPATLATTPRATLTIIGSGRALRIADIVTTDHLGFGDLCEVVPAGGLHCAAGAGDGTFAAATRVDPPARPLAIEPDSLALGDVDGDGQADACGHVASGILCALAADGFSASPWSDAFGPGASTAATTASIAIAESDTKPGFEICGSGVNGIACITAHGPAAPPPITTASTSADVWIADLDGDRRADWCTTQSTPATLVCGRGDDPRARIAGTAFDFAGVAVAETVDDEAFADIDGDGRADHCTTGAPADAIVWCARGQGYGFGPAFPITGLAGTPLLGDLDGDGIADVCAANNVAITCAR